MRLLRPLRAILTYASLVLILSTCDMANVLSTPKQRKVVLSFQSDSTLVQASSTKPAVQVTIDGAPMLDPQVRLASSDTTVIAISAGGDSLIARKLGRAIITASLEGTLLPTPLPFASDTIYVVPKEFTLDRATATLTAIGDTIRLVATAIDAANRAIPDPGVVWMSSDTSRATVSATGLVTARSNTSTPVTITARLDGISAVAQITVAQQIARFSFEPSTITFDALGAQSVIAVSARDRNGNAIPTLPTIAWTSGNAAIVSVHPTNGTLISLNSGSTFIRATATNGSTTVSDTVHVEVNQQATRIIISAVSGVTIGAIGGKLQLTARAYDRLNAEMKKPISWASLDGNVAGVDENGVVTSRGVGTARIVARVDTASAVQTITVTDDAVRLSLNPPSATLGSVNDSLVITVTAFNALDIPIASTAVTWRSTDSTIVKVLAPGLVRAERAGTATIIVSSGTLSAFAMITVTNAADQVNIVLGEATLASVNDSLVPQVVVTNARGVALGASSLLWSSDDVAVARVTATGTIIATGIGSTFIKAVSAINSTRRDSILISVTNAPATVVLSDNRDTLTSVGRIRTYTVTVRNARGARIAEAIVDWQSSVPSVASVVDGTATARGVGTTIITARSGAASATLELTVTNDAVSLDLQPPALNITSLDDTVRLSVSARNDLGSPIPPGQVMWSSTVTSVATVDASGNVVSKAIGTTRIIATSGALADTTVVTVTNTPSTIAITPDTVRLTSLGDSVTPPATLTNSRGATLPRTSATWSSDDPTIARVSASGVITARDTGTTIVRATSGSVSDAVVVVVTNSPAMLTFSTARDTLTAAGQTVSYSVAVTNAAGNAIDNPAVTYMSTNTGVATISGSGTGAGVTATGFGTTLIIARSGAVADTIVLVVVNPTVIYVDNSVFANPRTGTSSRPYAKIQDGVNAADPFDTVFVRKGNAAYSETVSLAKRIVLLGDSTFFSRSSPNPSVLPLISHDTGSAAITAITTSQEVIRFFRIRHTVDGLAVDARGSDIRLAHLFVNTDETSVAGGGISIDNTANGRPARVDSVRVNAVAGFGIRLNGVVNGTVRAARISLVDSASGFSGAGVEITGGQNNVVELSTIRRTGGAQVHGVVTATLTIRQNDLAGRHQLVRLVGVSGSTQVVQNTLDLQLRGDEPFSTGSAFDGRSGVHIDGSQGVALRENVFIDAIDGAMDGVRITGSRGTGALSSSSFGANLVRNRFTGGRYSVRSSSSSWMSEGMSSTGAVQGIVGENNDAISMFGDTISSSTSGCVDVTGNGSLVTIRGGTFQFCAGGASTTMQVAVRAIGSTTLSVDSSVFRGPNTTAIEHGSLGASGTLTVSRNTIVPSGPRTLPLGTRSAIIEARGTGQASIHRNVITDFIGLTGMVLAAGVSADVDSNLVARNGVAARVLTGATMAAVSNDWYANDTAAVVSQPLLFIPGNFWGDSAGPRRDSKLRAAGDSAAGPIIFSAVAPAPLYPGFGAASAMRLIWGAEQATGTVSKTVPLAKPFIVRIVDAQGRPLAGVTVRFAIASPVNPPPKWLESGTSTLDVRTGADGLARGTFDPNNKVGTHTTTISVPASPALGSITIKITSG